MRYSIKRKSEKIKKATLRSALFLVSAFAVFSPCDTYSETRETVAQPTLTARGVFEKLQCPALEILNRSTRLDMLDYWDVDSVYKAFNVMDGLSWLVEVDPCYLKVAVTPVSSLEIKILPAKKEPIVMTVYTVGDDVQAQDSQVNFYDCNLNQIPTEKHLEMPRVKDFFFIPKGSDTKMREIEDMIPFPTVAFSANPDNDCLKARLTVEKYMNQDDWNIAKLFAKPSITLEWKKEKYKY